MKKMLVIISVLVLILSLASGCNKTKTDKTETKSLTATASGKTTSTVKKTGTTTTKSDTTTSQEDYQDGDNDYPDDGDQNGEDFGDENDTLALKEYIYDFKGRTIKIAQHVGQTNRFVAYPTYQSLEDYVYGTDPNIDLQWDYAREIEKKFNCKLVVKCVAGPDAPAALSTFTMEVLSGICEYDIFNTMVLFTKPTFMVNNVVLPIGDYVPFDGDIRYDDFFIKTLAYYKGKYWGIPDDWPNNIILGAPQDVQSLVYNLDIRDKDGLPDPVEVAMNGNWSWETFTEVLKNATHDYDGDGNIDQWGINLVTQSVTMAVASNKGSLVTQKGDQFVFAADDSQTLRALTFISDLFNLHKVAITDNTIFKKNKAFMEAYPNGVVKAMPTTYTNFGYRVRLVRFPTGPDNYDGNITMLTNKTKISYIAATTPEPEGIAYLMTQLLKTYKDPNPVLDYPAAVNNDLDFIFQDDELSKDYWRITRLKVDPEKLEYGFWGSPFSEVASWVNSALFSNIAKQSIPIMPYIESIRPVMQSDIDKTAKQ